ncbi:hypothetical protein B2M27_04860 [Kluyvera intermedia]|uniref:Uncharacterized protein n=1 Tax=Kluyvera intermedia TaxID=61648 RepID=A0ABX3UJ67_KLUIN|nr:hypothetical protein B2M27_04860 [Kluyvera intermedia]
MFVVFLSPQCSILVIPETILKFICWNRFFNIGEVASNIETPIYQCVTFSILVINVLSRN